MKKSVSFDAIEKAYRNGNLFDAQVAVDICPMCEDIPLDFITEVLLSAPDLGMKMSMARAMATREIPKKTLLCDGYIQTRLV